jgi:hypothetical protein
MTDAFVCVCYTQSKKEYTGRLSKISLDCKKIDEQLKSGFL